jgi:hypothetical protein
VRSKFSVMLEQFVPESPGLHHWVSRNDAGWVVLLFVGA